MKIKIDKDILTIYLYEQILLLDDKETLTNNVKELLIKLVTYHHLTFNGMYEVIIYDNKHYGYILDVIKIKDFDYSEYIDIKLEIRRNRTFYLEFDNYNYIEKNHEIRCFNEKFYVNINEFNNVNRIIEFTNIIYHDDKVREINNVNNKIQNVN